MGKCQSSEQQLHQKITKQEGEERFKIGGYYSQIGLKQGIWIEKIQSIKDTQVFEMGEYYKDVRVGKWKCIQNQRQMYYSFGQSSAGGQYDYEGHKKGKWIELAKIYSEVSQVIYIGEYNKIGEKVGRWDIMNCNSYEMGFKQIGGGIYDQESYGKKIGQWFDLDEGFQIFKQITYQGQYNMKGVKVGRWQTWWNWNSNKLIGVGSYNQEGDGKKIGKWVELDDEFCNEKQVTYKGEYNMKGIKVGRWDIWLKWRENQLIGGGNYNQEGDGIKIGEWVQLDERFCNDKQITHKGEYNEKGMKVGRWDIMYDFRDGGGYIQIGGGCYDNEGEDKKIGKWVELDDEFRNDKEVIYKGEYNLKGIKIGKWDTWWDWNYQTLSGGGTYSQEGDKKKIGKWIELDNGFCNNKKVIYKGEYNMKGLKVGRWDIMYDRKDGRGFRQMQEIILQGTLKMVSGGGAFDLEGEQRKIGQWVDIDEGFKYDNQVAYKGKYNMQGKKVGTWQSIDIYLNKKCGEKKKYN